MTEVAIITRACAPRWGKRHLLIAALFAGSMAACGVRDADSVGEPLGIPGSAPAAMAADPGLACHGIVVETAAATRGSGALDMSVLRAEQTNPVTVTITRHDFVEIQERRPFGLEQSWRFDRAAGVTGDLRIAVDLPGLRYLAPAPAGLHFQGHGCDVFYGDGTWIDATGRRVALPARVDGGRVTLFVPADVVADSMYPVAVDPQIVVDPIGGG
jgi:hypothetical protein